MKGGYVIKAADLRVRYHMRLEYHLVHPPIIDYNPPCRREMEAPVHEVGIRLRN